MYVIQHAESISSRGAKYVIRHATICRLLWLTTHSALYLVLQYRYLSRDGASGGDTAKGHIGMTDLYTSQILSVLIPHLLACLEHVFPSQKTKKRGKAVALLLADPSSPEAISMLKVAKSTHTKINK